MNFDELTVEKAIEVRNIALKNNFKDFMDDLAVRMMDSFSTGLSYFNTVVPETVDIQEVTKALNDKGFRAEVFFDAITVFIP